MRKQAQQIVQKLWSYCNILRDDGLSYPDYVEQLTYLLFLKMAHELATASPKTFPILPGGYDWHSLVSKKDPRELHKRYGEILKKLAVGNGMLGIIFYKAENKIRDPEKLQLLVVDLIDKRNWSALDIDVKGDAYEGLLEKNAQDTKSGAGQYFTPRPVIRAIVDCIRPRIGERIYDPACGTCGFLLAAYDYVVEHNRNLSERQLEHLRLEAFRGVELVSAVTRLGAMNMFLHNIGPKGIEQAQPPIVTNDSLKTDPGERFEVVLTNPPFGKKSSMTSVTENGDRERQSLNIVRPDFLVSTSNKQLNFLQHINTVLKADGRAAVVIPDNVLFEGGAGEIIRRHFLDNYDLHTLLRLPPGIFYAQGIKTNVIFFDRKLPSQKGPRKLWIYDLRTNMHFTLHTKRLERPDLDEFVACYKAENRSLRRATWSAKMANGRWRAYGYEELRRRDKCNLDIFWLKDEAQDMLDLTVGPSELASEIVDELQAALNQISEIASDLADVS
jgi:type I restriction enzyme M protein